MTKKKAATSGLATRHVFLDTQVYQAHSYNLESGPFTELRRLVDMGHIVIHISDITLAELERHIHEDAQKFADAVATTNRHRERWKVLAPKATGDTPADIDGKAVGKERFSAFRSKLYNKLKINAFNAMNQSAGDIFKHYFASKAPFDQSGSKEFPDAFVISALAAIAKKTREPVYVVTGDNAMGRAAEETGHLLPLDSLQALLTMVTSVQTPEAEAAATPLVERDTFIDALQKNIEDNLGSIEFGNREWASERGDLEIMDIALDGEITISDFSVISAGTDNFGLIMNVNVPFAFWVTYKKNHDFSCDPETGEPYYRSETVEATIYQNDNTRVFVRIDRDSGDILRFELITSSIWIN